MIYYQPVGIALDFERASTTQGMELIEAESHGDLFIPLFRKLEDLQKRFPSLGHVTVEVVDR